jgi:hypothetical protein
MKRKLIRVILFTVFISIPGLTIAQPIPVEFMMGNKNGIINLSFARNFSEQSKLGFFHMNTVQFDYNDEDKNSFILQDLLYYEPLKNFRIAGGAAYSKGGFNPTAGIQYIYSGRKLFILFAPRVNIESEPSYDFMTILQYKPQLNDKLKLYTRFQMLNLFDSGGNIRSYQWFRLGIEIKKIQFGLAVNFDEYGPDPGVEPNFGLFIRKELF